MSENMQCLVFCFCVSLLRMMLSSFIHVPEKDVNPSFFMPAWCVCATFSLSSLSLMGIWVGSKSLLLWTVLQKTYVCMSLYSTMISNFGGIYSKMGLLGQMVFLVLDTWGIATLSSTVVELIYIPTNSVKVFLFLHVVCSIQNHDVSWFFSVHHSNWCETVSPWGFDLHLSNDQ